MTGRHALLGVLVAALWGLNFVAARMALAHVTPLLLVALRFSIAALPAMFVPRPPVALWRMLALASTLFIGQFVFLFWGIRAGMPAGLASVVTQAQAVFTVVVATVTLHEVVSARMSLGLAVATVGVVVIGATVGSGGVSIVGLGLTLLAAASWAAGNILLRGVGQVDRFALIVWLSLIPPAPMLLLCLAVEGKEALWTAFQGEAWLTLGAVLYISLAATLGGYGLWGYLLKLYPASTVAPFALLAPPFGLAAAHFVLGEQFGAMRMAEITLVLFGLAVAILPNSLKPWLVERVGRSTAIDEKSGLSDAQHRAFSACRIAQRGGRRARARRSVS